MKVSTTKNGSYKDALFKLQYLYKPKPMSKIPFTVKKVIRQKRNEYHRNWQKQNPEKVQQAQQRFWEKKAKQEQEGDN